MVSESARMSSAAEARFRIDKPNSRPRAIKVVALDHRSDPILEDLAQRDWQGATFFKAAELTSRPERLRQEVDSADLVVMLATAGEPVSAVSTIGDACSQKRVTTTGLILCGAETPDEAVSTTLGQMRPWMLMLVIASSTDYIVDMLRALRA